MNTLETAFDKWCRDTGRSIVVSPLTKADLELAFGAGYIAGFDHAKKEALSTLAKSLDPRPTVSTTTTL